ncbi:MAG: cation:proton antiporter [Sporocytophaga sp.]|uniref:cation:proton antiporter n=1 Tax=Sporocytophaga sp. TaxID=2231183 RepID=UPI001B027353|nr:cation:proton antiporter [Sporocytophaga sp.]MBO9701462.1 cation:proton antiporter [Sporocytophaga sp.]
MKKNLIFYTLFTGGFSLLIWFLLNNGKHLEAERILPQLASAENNSIFSGLNSNLHNPLSTLILQITIILVVARILGYLFQKAGQPSVVGEIIAGIALGPSLLGLYFPEASSFIFPVASLGNIQFLSQIGLILFMFIVGMDIDGTTIKNQAHQAVIISHASIIFPFFLGVVSSFFLYSTFAPPTIPFVAFALFMGIAMSITAFPVLARIVHEKGLSKHPIGMMSLTCAAADDVTAWCVLAAVIAIVKATSVLSALLTLVLAAAYLIFMLYVVKPGLKKLFITKAQNGEINKSLTGIIFLVLLLSSYICELIGIHALFGAFIAGVIMPEELNLKKIISEKIEDVALVLLLPLFFVFTGLRTQVNLLNNPNLWIVCLGIIVLAVLGKLVGSALAARITGLSWKRSLSIGVLMNTRGLMELVVLNIGYDLGVLSTEIFTIMVIMAIVTTFMTGPFLNFITKNIPDHELVENEKTVNSIV